MCTKQFGSSFLPKGNNGGLWWCSNSPSPHYESDVQPTVICVLKVDICCCYPHGVRRVFKVHITYRESVIWFIYTMFYISVNSFIYIVNTSSSIIINHQHQLTSSSSKSSSTPTTIIITNIITNIIINTTHHHNHQHQPPSSSSFIDINDTSKFIINQYQSSINQQSSALIIIIMKH